MMMADLLVLLFLGVILSGLELTRPFGRTIREDYLSADSGRSLRGVLSVGILFHHLGQKRMGLVFLPLLSRMGYFLVSVFFFLSGYGLMKQHMTREDYRRRFFSRRLPAILVPYGVACVLYGLLYAAMGEPWTFRAFLQGLYNGTPMVSASWYILCITLFYIAFGCLMWLCGRHYGWMLAGGGVFLGAYVFFCVKMGYGSWWYNTAPVLLLGMAWALKQQWIDEKLRRSFPGIALGVLFLFALLYGGKLVLNSAVPSPLLHIPLTWCVCCLFVCAVNLLLTQVKLSSPLLAFLGDISLEIYLCQFLLLQLLRSSLCALENDFLYAACVLVGTITFAWVLHRVNRWLMRIRK